MKFKFWLATKYYLFFFKGKPDHVTIYDIVSSYVFIGQLLVFNLLYNYLEIKIIILIAGILFFLKKFLDAFLKEVLILIVITYTLMAIYTATLHFYAYCYYSLESYEFSSTIMAMNETKILKKTFFAPEHSYGYHYTRLSQKYISHLNILDPSLKKHLMLENSLDFEENLKKENKIMLQLKATQDYYDQTNLFSNKRAFQDKYYFEGAQKIKIVEGIYLWNLANKDIEPLKFFFTNASTGENLQPFIEKGGDVLILQGQHVISIELKYRWKEFDSLNAVSQYIDAFTKNYGKKQIISIDCDSTKIYLQILNYIKQSPEPYDEFYCFAKEDLDDPYLSTTIEKIEILENLPLKNEFSNIVLQDVSFFKRKMTQVDFDFINKILEESFDDITIEEYKKIRAEVFSKVKNVDFFQEFGKEKIDNKHVSIFKEVLQRVENSKNALIKYENSEY